MSSTEKLVIKFFIQMLSTDVETVLQLKELALNYYEQGYLTATEHCDLEAILDNALIKF